MKRLFVFIAIVAVAIGGIIIFGNRKQYVKSLLEEGGVAFIHDIFKFQEGLSTLTQIECDNPNRRPIAVMLSSDREARPLAGIASADVVIEMPVVTGLITRMMALYQCEDVEEIGSVRSSRHDFIPLAASFDAIYAHWGGSVLALRELDRGVIDNIDAMVNLLRAYWEKPGIRAPHAGFTSTNNLLGVAEYLGYRTETNTRPFRMQPEEYEKNAGTIIIGYPRTFIVSFYYNPETGLYERFRDGRPEIDKNTGEQVAVSNVIVMRAESHQVLDDYNDVTLDGVGDVFVYRNGREIKGFWKYKETFLGEPLQLFNGIEDEIAMQPGKTWISIIELDQRVEWIQKQE